VPAYKGTRNKDSLYKKEIQVSQSEVEWVVDEGGLEPFDVNQSKKANHKYIF
jgi:hypothetical protein